MARKPSARRQTKQSEHRQLRRASKRSLEGKAAKLAGQEVGQPLARDMRRLGGVDE